jgi:hypothetical protein
MKISEAHRTQASSLHSATPIGAPMRPTNRRGGPNMKINYWSTVPGLHCLLARGTSERQFIGAPRLPCANILADRTQKNRKNVRILNGPGGGSFGAPIMLKRSGPNSSVRLAYFQANRLLTDLYKQEMEIR